ncbi:MAG: hypothetical protein ACR2IK_14805 [Chloroflexota bacterium]
MPTVSAGGVAGQSVVCRSSVATDPAGATTLAARAASGLLRGETDDQPAKRLAYDCSWISENAFGTYQAGVGTLQLLLMPLLAGDWWRMFGLKTGPSRATAEESRAGLQPDG